MFIFSIINMRNTIIALLLLFFSSAHSQAIENSETTSRIKQLDQLLLTEPTAENYYSRGYLKYMAGDNKGAFPDYDKAIQIDPEYFDAYYSRGMLKDKIEDYKGAVEDYTICILLDEYAAKAHFNRAFCKSKINDYVGAIDDYSKCIDINPEHFSAYMNRGIIKQNKGLFGEAILDFDEAILIKPDFTDAFQNRAICKAMVNRKDALNDFNKVVELDAENPESYYNRALYFINYKVAGNYCNDLKMAQSKGYAVARKLIAEKCK